MTTDSINADSYETKVNQALESWLKSRKLDRFKSLTARLGCLFMCAPDSVVQPSSQADEDVVKKAWLAVFYAHDAREENAWMIEHHLMMGLLVNDRWSPIFDAKIDAREFVAIAATHFSGHQGEALIGVRLWTQLRAAMPGSVGRQTVLVGDRAEQVIARSFFHEAWVSIVFDGRKRGQNLADLIRLTQPTFRPGILSVDSGQAVTPLPSLGC